MKNNIINRLCLCTVISCLLLGCGSLEASTDGSETDAEVEMASVDEAVLDSSNFDHELAMEASSNNETVREAKKGFNSATNDIYAFSKFIIEIPNYWTNERELEDGLQRYAETGEKVAMLQIEAAEDEDPDYVVDFDSLMEDNENMIASIESTVFEKVTDYEVLDTGVVKGILYKGTIKTGEYSGSGLWFSFPSEEDRNWCQIIMVQTDNTEFDYVEDFDTIIHSIRKADSVTKIGESSTEETVVEEVEQVKNDVLLPDSNTKLGKDYDSRGNSTVYYINVDDISNKPELAKWGKVTVTDGVAEYLDELKAQGYKIDVLSTDKQTPYEGYTLYTSSFKASNEYVSWTMDLTIQDEKYTEYELDIYMP